MRKSWLTVAQDLPKGKSLRWQHRTRLRYARRRRALNKKERGKFKESCPADAGLGIAQRGDVWFLAGSTGGKVTRTCSVPEGVKLFVPVVNTFCFPDAAFSDAFCVIDTDNFIDSFQSGTVSLTVDGTPVTVTDVRDETDFNFAVDANGIFGTKPGIYRATIARGLWGLLGPLAPGAHTVTIDAAGPLFGLSVSYSLNVVSPAN